ncbi:MAG: hydrogenase maturation protease [Desulfobacteraceae bacterium]|jgi:hydrogenase maturation protease
MVQDTNRFNTESPGSRRITLVIGVGNELRGDDGVGPFIARKIKAKKMPRTLVEIHVGETTSLLELWADAAAVILLDAVKSGAGAGKIYRLNPRQQSIPSSFFRFSTHNFGLAECVRLAKTLKRLPPCLIIYGIEGKNFENGTGLSPEVEKAALEVTDLVTRDVYRHLEDQHITDLKKIRTNP